MRLPDLTPEVTALLEAGAPVGVGVSGGKDSHAVATCLSRYLKDYKGPKILVHANLGSVEWDDSLPACQRVADQIGWELVVVKRKAGGMMDRWKSRWESSVRRYQNMETVAVVLPWSTPSMRFCTSELKTDPITSYFKKRFGKVPMLNVTGVRAAESAARAKQPVSKPINKLPPGSMSWSAIHSWSAEDVWGEIADSGIVPHEAYETFGAPRVSCRFCILAADKDLQSSLKDPRSVKIYQEMCELELESRFAFKGNLWLTSLSPHFVRDGGLRLADAKAFAEDRVSHQSWIPKHLQFSRGWPNCIPTESEAEQLASMRRVISCMYHWDSSYVSARSIRERYEELMEIKASKKKK